MIPTKRFPSMEIVSNVEITDTERENANSMSRSQDSGNSQNQNLSRMGTAITHQTTHNTEITTIHRFSKDKIKTTTIKTEIKETANSHTTKTTINRTRNTLQDNNGETPETDLQVGTITEISAKYVENQDTQPKIVLT